MFRKIRFLVRAVRYKVWFYANKGKFKSFGRGSYIKFPLAITGHKNIIVGSNVFIGYKTWLGSMPHTGDHECLLEFGDWCSIGNFNHIYATKKIVFGKKVLTADRVYISDNLHEYERIDIAILDQPIKQIDEVYIGDGCWIGENVSIIGASVGKNSIVGANSVVTKSIPDYSVAVGVPARIIKRYCFDTKTWRQTLPDGNFLK